MKNAILIAALALAGCGGGTVQPAATQHVARSNIVAFMGDSITAGWNIPAYYNGPSVNFGISGQSTNQMLARFSEVTAAGAGVVVILGGTNDLAGGATPQDILANITAMAARADAAGIRVILCSITATTTSAPLDHQHEQAIIDTDVLILELAQSKGYLYADYYDALLLADGLADPSLLFDGLHPDAAGYVKMWDVVEPLIQEDLQ